MSDKHSSPVVPTPSRRQRTMPRHVTPGWTLVVVLLVFFLIWEFISRFGWISPMFISRPTAIIAAIPELVNDATVMDAVKTTGLAILEAIVYGIVVGGVLGYLCGGVRVLRDAFYGPALFLMSVPKSIFIPIFLVLFGIEPQTAVYYGAFSAFIYMMINVIGGLDLIERQHLDVAHAYDASVWQRLVHVILPASVPGAFTGIWYAIKDGLQGVLILELFISVGGLGSVIQNLTNRVETDKVFALIIGVSIAAIVIGESWSVAERRLSRWRPSDNEVAAT